MTNTIATGSTVISMTRFREAVRAATFLRGCYHDPAWLKTVTVQVGVDGDVRVLVTLLWTTPLIVRCVSHTVDNVPVVIAVEGGR